MFIRRSSTAGTARFWDTKHQKPSLDTDYFANSFHEIDALEPEEGKLFYFDLECHASDPEKQHFEQILSEVINSTAMLPTPAH